MKTRFVYGSLIHIFHTLSILRFRFIEFGRGKVIPLTPENSKADLATEISNIGRIVVNKCIEKIEKVDTNASLLFGPYDMVSGSSGTSVQARKLQQQQSIQGCGGPGGGHKKKRLYSLGGNEPIRIHRGRLNRLKTVGTFDLTIEEVPRGESGTECVGGALESGSGLTASTSTANSTSTELFTASSNPNSSSSCLNSPKELQLRKHQHQRRAGKLARHMDCVGTSSESFENSNSNNKATGGGTRKIGQVRSAVSSVMGSRTSSSLDTKTNSTEDDEDPVTMISNKVVGGGRIRGTSAAAAATDSDEVRSPDEVFSQTKSILSKSSEFKARKSTFKKSKRITRTDSELIHDDEMYRAGEEKRGGSLAKYSTDSNDSVLSPTKAECKTRLMSTSMGTEDFNEDEVEGDIDEQADRFSLHGGGGGGNLRQREYKSDGNSLDEIGLQRDPDAIPPQKWMNHSLEDCVIMSTSSMEHIPQPPPKRDSSVDSARGKSQTPPAVGKLFENPFSKFRMINKVWKGKKFSLSSGNVVSGGGVLSPGTTQEGEPGRGVVVVGVGGGSDTAQDIISPTSVVSDSPKVTLSSSSIFSKIRQQARTATSSPSSSVASSHRSHPRRLFSRLTSISNTDLYKTGVSGAVGAGRSGRSPKDFSKSNSEINTPTLAGVSPFRKNTIKKQKQSVKALKLEKMKNNSAGCLAERKMAITEPEGVHTVNKVQSPLSEEFYNKTGSVRLSAVELFEKFCSSDFSGLYKHETELMTRRQAVVAAPAKRYIYRKNSKLLKQRSEPRFTLSMHQQQFRFDEDGMLGETYYEEEGGMYEDKEEMEEEMGEEYYEDEYYEEGEYEGELDEEEEEQAEGEDKEAMECGGQKLIEEDASGRPEGQPQQEIKSYQYQQHQLDEYIDEIGEDELSTYDMRRERFCNLHIGHRVTEEDEEACVLEGEEVLEVRRQSENMFIFEHSNEDQEVDEIILMPETTCMAAAYPTMATSTRHLHRTEVIYDLNNLSNSEENVMAVAATCPSNALLLSVIKDYVRHSGGETGEAEISVLDNCRDFEVKSVDEDILTIYRICSEENVTVTRSHMSSSKSDTQFVSRRSFQSGQKLLQHHGGSCRSRKHSRSEALTPMVTVELNDGKSGSNESDLGDMEEDTVRFLCPDSFGSRLSLSLFDDLSLNFSLTLSEVDEKGCAGGAKGMQLLAPDCDAEDFNLTSEGSVSDCVDIQFRIVESLPSDCSSENNNTMNDDVEADGRVTFDSAEKRSVNKEDVVNTDEEKEKRDPEKETPLNEVVTVLIENMFERQDSISIPDYEGNSEEMGEENNGEEQLEDEEDPNHVSKFTNELQREFDMLFDIAATKPNVEVEVDMIQIEPHSGHSSIKIPKSASGYSHYGGGNSLIASIRTRISSRHSMQNLEPYEPMMDLDNIYDTEKKDEEAEVDVEKQGPKTSKSVDQLHEKQGVMLNSKKGLLSVAAAVAAKNKSKSSLVGGPKGAAVGDVDKKARKQQGRDNVNEDDSEMYVGCVHLLCSRFKKRKSLSLGNLEKSKCFPL